MRTTILEVLRQYHDGESVVGITGLADQTGRHRSAFYKLANAENSSPPWDLIAAICTAFDTQEVVGIRGKVTATKLANLWNEAKAAQV